VIRRTLNQSEGNELAEEIAQYRDKMLQALNEEP
jgi:hypothetical protein